METPTVLSLDGQIVPWEQGTVHVTSAAFKYGASVFEGLRGYWNQTDQQLYVFRAPEHLHRLEYSQRFHRFDTIYDAATVSSHMVDLLRAMDCRSNVHIVTTAYLKGGANPGVTGPVGLAITAVERAAPDWVKNGVSAQVSSWMRVPDQAMPMRVKTTANYNNGRLAALQATADGYDAPLMLNARGKLSEGPGMCFIMIRGGKAVMPSITNDILESITRETIIQILREDMSIEVIERDIDRSELVAAEEAFFCGTAWEVTPITSIDRLTIGNGQPGPLTRQLQKHYFGICDGSITKHAEWRLPIHDHRA
ncbi:aminotransferase class IV [Alphaproteobacteria bacterium]|nr:aminotransferase class IV [Alphaproteobacteria bacterium]